MNKVYLCLYEFIVWLGISDPVIWLKTQNLKFEKDKVESRINALLNFFDHGGRINTICADSPNASIRIARVWLGTFHGEVDGQASTD